jgi:hypothetical protein
VARDAIARQYDVDKNSVKIEIGTGGKEGYYPGTITFFPKKGRSIDLAKMHESIKATRLSGGTSMKIAHFDITATGEVVTVGKETVLKVMGTKQQFTLGEDPSLDAKVVVKGFQELQKALARGEKVTSVTGRVQGWSGLFPQVMKALPGASSKTGPGLIVLDFETAK